MKRFVLIAFTAIFLCGLLLPAAIVNAYVSGYEWTDYNTSGTHVVDGKWTASTEWTDAMTPPNLVTGFLWRGSWTYPADIVQWFIVEIYTDNTNDTGDVVRVCYDCAANGGTTPQSDDVMIELVGDRASGLSLYHGNGTGWQKFTGWTASEAAGAATISSSQLNSTPHLIVEFMIDKTTQADISQAGYVPWIYVSAFDASNSAAGTKSWPPATSSTANSPNTWGQETGTMDTIPESTTILSIVLLSSVAVAVGLYFLKKPKAPNFSAGRIRK